MKNVLENVGLVFTTFLVGLGVGFFLSILIQLTCFILNGDFLHSFIPMRICLGVCGILGVIGGIVSCVRDFRNVWD